MGNRQESTWSTLLVEAHTVLRLLLMANSIHGAEGTTVDWAMVSSIYLEFLYLIIACLLSVLSLKKSCHLAGFLGSSEDQTTPMLVTALKGLKVVDVACGSGDAQTLAVTENGKNKSQLVRTSDNRIR